MIHKGIVIVKGYKDYNIKSDYEDRLDTMIDNVMKGIYIETKKKYDFRTFNRETSIIMSAIIISNLITINQHVFME